MNIADIYERVRVTVPEADERLFVNHYNDTVTELDGLYGSVKKLLYTEGNTEGYIEGINEDNKLLPLYDTAIADNIIYLFNNNIAYKQEFIRKSENAHLHYWRHNTKGKTIKSLRARRGNNDIQK